MFSSILSISIKVFERDRELGLAGIEAEGAGAGPGAGAVGVMGGELDLESAAEPGAVAALGGLIKLKEESIEEDELGTFNGSGKSALGKA